MAGDSSWCCRNPHGQNLKNKAAGSVVAAAAAAVVAGVVVAGVVGVMAGEGRELGYLFITETHSLSCFSNLGRKEGRKGRDYNTTGGREKMIVIILNYDFNHFVL